MAPSVARIGQEKDPAMPATGEAGPKVRIGILNGPQEEIVLQNEITHSLPEVPSRVKLEMLLDFDSKKPRLSLKMLMDFCIASFYYMAPSGSRGRARFF